jgi:hypothetical protein
MNERDQIFFPALLSVWNPALSRGLVWLPKRECAVQTLVGWQLAILHQPLTLVGQQTVTLDSPGSAEAY